MWPKLWGKSPSGRINTTNYSFKDVQSLCNDDDDNKTNNKPGPDGGPPQPKKPSLLHRVRISTSVVRRWTSTTKPESIPKPEPQQPEPEPEPEPEYVATPTSALSIEGAETRIVVYFTSLRVVRKTFEDCRTVRSILRGFRVRVDERDLSMDAGFLEELQGVFGQQEKLSLPQVFIGGRYVGGAEEIRQLNETGELKKFVEGLPAAEPGVYDGCGGYRFVLCDQCDGSRKCFLEKGGGFRSCLNCNENGLIRCPACSSFVPP